MPRKEFTGYTFNKDWVVTASTEFNVEFNSDSSVIRDGFGMKLGCRGTAKIFT